MSHGGWTATPGQAGCLVYLAVLLPAALAANILFGINNLAISLAVRLFGASQTFQDGRTPSLGLGKRKPFMMGWLLAPQRRYAERPRLRCL